MRRILPRHIRRGRPNGMVFSVDYARRVIVGRGSAGVAAAGQLANDDPPATVPEASRVRSETTRGPRASPLRMTPAPRIGRNIAGILAGAFGVFLLGYVILRAALLPFTFDESLSYLDYIRLPVPEIVSATDVSATLRPFTANNHILNSLLAKASIKLFGVSELALRLPNVIAFAAFLFVLWLFLRRLAPPGLALAGYLAIAANPFLLDWFSLCRGYGLSVALLIVGLFLIVTALEGGRRHPGRAALGFLCLDLAVAASFVVFHVLLATAATAVVVDVTRLFSAGRGRARAGWAETAKEIALPIAAVAVPAALFGPILAVLSRNHELWFGGKTGFWSDTVKSLVESSLYGASYAGLVLPIVLGAVAISAMVVAAVAVGAVRRRSEGELRFLAVACLGAATAAATIAAHALFGVKYLITRTAVFFVPLLFLALFGALGLLARAARRPVRIAAFSAGGLIGAASILHFAAAGNLKRPLYWAYDMDTPAMLTDLGRLRQGLHSATAPFHLGVDARLAPSIEFYRVTQGIRWLAPVDQQSPWRKEIEFVYLQPFEREDALRNGVRILRTYEQTGNILGMR